MLPTGLVGWSFCFLSKKSKDQWFEKISTNSCTKNVASSPPMVKRDFLQIKYYFRKSRLFPPLLLIRNAFVLIIFEPYSNSCEYIMQFSFFYTILSINYFLTEKINLIKICYMHLKNMLNNRIS